MARFPLRFRRRVRESTAGIELTQLDVDDATQHGPNQQNPSSRVLDKSIPHSILFQFTERSHAKWLVSGLIAAVLKGLAAPAAALVTGKIFGIFTSFQNGTISAAELIKLVSTWSLYLMAVGAGRLVLQAVFSTSWDAFGEAQALSARQKVFGALLDKDTLWFESLEEGTTALVARLNTQIDDLQSAMSQPLGAVPSIMASGCFSLILAMYFSWKLTLVIIASVPVVIIFVLLTNRPITKYCYAQQQNQTTATKLFSGILAAIDIVKCYNAQTLELTRYADQIRKVAYWYLRAINIHAQHQGFVQFVASCLFIQAFYYGGTLVRSGEKTPGDIITTFLSAVAVFTSLNSINSQMLYMELGRIASGKLRDIISQQGRDTSIALRPRLRRSETLPSAEGWIRFEDVMFSYPNRPSQVVLDGLDMNIKMNKLSFVIGKSGSGKSTIAQLLTRLYEPTSGSITMTHLSRSLPLTRFSKWNLREYVHLVEQQSILFDDTIGVNIALGNPNGLGLIDTQEVEHAIDLTLLRNTLSGMPHGVQTQVGRRGDALSGGQRQRVALARAYIRNAPVLILDESTSALEKADRMLVIDAVRVWRRNKTTIIITHDLDLIKPNDYTFILDEGRLENEGLRRDLRELDNTEVAYTTTIRPVTPSLGSWSTLSGQSFLDVPLTPASSRITNPFQGSPHSIDHDTTPRSGFNRSFPADFSVNRTLKLPQPVVDDSVRQSRLISRSSSVHWLQESPSAPRLPFDHAQSLVARPSSILPHLPSSVSNHELQQTDQRSRRRSFPFQRSSFSRTSLVERGQQTQRTGAERRDLRHRRNASERLDDIDEGNTALDHTQTYTFRAILGTVWPSITLKQRFLLLLAFTSCVLHSAASPALSLFATRLIETYSFDSESPKMARTYALWILGIAIIDGATVYLQQISWEYIAQCWINTVRAKAADKVMAQPKAFFNIEKNSPARLVEIMDRHADQTRNIMGRMAPLYITVFTVSILSAIWATITEWRLSVVMLAFLPVIMGWAFFFGAMSRKWDAWSNDAVAEINAVFIETFTCIRTVKLHTIEYHFRRKVTKAISHAYRVGLKRSLVAGVISGLTEAGQVLAQAAIFYVAARLAAGGVSVPGILLVLLMLIMTFSQVGMMVSAIPQASQARDAATRFLSLAKLPENTHESEGRAGLASAGAIEFRNVSFVYPSAEAHKVLLDFSLRLERGKYLALVGASGAGKSMVAHLLLRLYSLGGDANAGEILISGKSISEYTVTSLRRRIALVQQATPLLDGTIAANIAYGLPSASMARIREAAEAAGLAQFIESLEHGYETAVGEGGQGLSGGQQQRLAIARALIRDPDVLVLDEVTSALDGESAIWIRDSALDLIRRGMTGGRETTVIAITHDRRMMECADQVAVMDGGKIVEQGTFGGLMMSGGRLTELLKS